MRNRPFSAAALLFGMLLGLAGTSASAEESCVIVGAWVADGSGKPLRKENVRVVGDRIAAVGLFGPRDGERVIQGSGLVLAPGFIDIHNHSTEGIAAEPLAASQISQGITTLILGADGSSPWPIADYLQKRWESPAAVNVGALVGHATVREQVLGEDYRRHATPEETARMASLVEQAMREGAFGLSSGLEYDVGSYSETEELVALAAAARGGFYMTHIRDEADKSLEAFAEAIAIGERGGIPVQISHIKLGTVGVWGKTPEVLAQIDGARRRGLDVTADAYPYTAWHSNIEVLVPNKRYDDPESVAEALKDVGGAANITISRCRAHPEYERRDLEEIARGLGITPVELFIRIVREGGADVIGHSMREEDVAIFLRQPWTMIASDGGIGSSHPRGAGAFPRVLARYVRERGLLTLPEAIRRMTSLPARRLKLSDRGSVRPGMKADLVLFDLASVADRSTFADPQRLAQGIRMVLVNGETVWEEERATGARPGRVLTPAGEFRAGEVLPLASRVDALFREYDRKDSPGCALSVVRGGEVLHRRGYGMASLEHGVAIQPDTVFDIGSVGKQFTAASVLLLEEQGKLSLEDDLRRYVWELPDWARKIKIRHLLHHTSGLPDYIDLLSLAGRRTEDLSTDEEALAAMARQRSLEFEPGTRHAYSNSGYFLLSLIVQRVSGQRLRDFARDSIFTPLGMTSTEYVEDHTQIVPRRATGYAPAPGGGFRLDASDWEQNGDGGVQTTVEDLARWDANFYHPIVGGPSFAERMEAVGRLANGERLSYAAGLRVDEYRGARRVSHGGSWAGFRANVTRFPQHRFSVMTLCNLSTADSTELSRGVVDIYLHDRLGPERKSPTPPVSIRPAPSLREAGGYAGLYWNRENDAVRRIVLRKGRLFYQRGEGDESELVPLGEGRFAMQGASTATEVKFEPQDRIRRQEMRVAAEGGSPSLYEAVAPASPRPQELAGYAGSFLSEELDARYEIHWEGDRLLLRRAGYPEAPLEPVFGDTFRDAEVGLLHFARDASGQVCGFRVRAGRLGILFEREQK